MSTTLDVKRTDPIVRRFTDWLDFPDLFRWFDERRPALFEEHMIRVEEKVADGMLTIRAEAPGIDPEKDAEITVGDGVLQIRVERRQEDKVDEPGRYRSEFRYGSYARSVPLPSDTDPSSVVATYENGILEVRVPVPASEAATAERATVPISKK